LGHEATDEVRPATGCKRHNEPDWTGGPGLGARSAAQGGKCTGSQQCAASGSAIDRIQDVTPPCVGLSSDITERPGRIFQRRKTMIATVTRFQPIPLTNAAS
jgi:hypothetical protein